MTGYPTIHREVHVGVYEARHNGALGEVYNLGVRGTAHLLRDLGDLPVLDQDLPQTGEALAHPVEDVAAHQHHRYALRHGLSLPHLAGPPHRCPEAVSRGDM